MKKTLLTLCVLALAAGQAAAQAKPSIIATVNGRKIAADEMGRRMWWNHAERTLQELIDEALILQEGERIGVKPSKDEVEARFKAIASSYKTADDLNTSLKGIGYTQKDLRLLIEKQITIRDTAIKAAGIKVGDEQAKAFYEANKEALARPESVRVRQFFSTSKADAEDALKMLDTGADFATLVMLKSSDENLKRSGGELGYLNRGVLLPALEKEVFALTPGKFTGVIATGTGFSIFKSEDYRARAVPELKAINDELKALILNRAVAQAVQELTAKLRQQAKIEIKK